MSLEFLRLLSLLFSLLKGRKQKMIEERYTKPCTYWDYILPGELTKLQKGREGDPNNNNHIICCHFNFEFITNDLFVGKGLNHHDEHLFIIVHQTFELWFKQVEHFDSSSLLFFSSCSCSLSPYLSYSYTKIHSFIYDCSDF
jgi:hypothetical protein